MNVQEFRLPLLERVVSGPGSLARLPVELDRYGCTRAVVVTGRSLAASALAARVRELLGSRCAGVFDGSRQHVPASTVEALAAFVREVRADSLVSLGGGSPIDTAKAAVHSSGRALVHVALPTTLSAGEFTDVAGVTDDATRVKRAIHGAHLAPRTVIADPDATCDTPDWLWAASGIRALDHAIETLYSSRLHPISEPLAVRAIEMLVEHLPLSIRSDRSDRSNAASNSNDADVPNVNGPNDSNDPNGSNDPNDPSHSRVPAHRASCQLAAWLAVFGVTNAGFGLSHVLGHQIGPRWNVAHGVTSAIVLPHAMRFMAAHAPDRFRPIARGFGIPFDGREPEHAACACAARTAEFIAPFNLPARLRDVGVPESGMGEIAEHVCRVLRDARVIDRPMTVAEVNAVLAAGW